MTAIPEWMNGEVSEYDLELASAPETILDIGANVGAYTVRSRQRYPDAKIFAYEPVKENADRFKAQCGELPGVELVEKAVRDFNGTSEIMLARSGVNCGFHPLGRQLEDQRRSVECLSSFNLPKADLVKVDTEGCEIEILRFLDMERAKAIVCEYHRPEDRQAIIDLCKAKGFGVASEKHHSRDNGILKFAKPGVLKSKSVKLFVGLPIYAQVPAQFLQCLLAFQANKPCPIELHVCQGDGVARSRNQLTAAFLKSDCTHMLMIDCDLIFSSEQIGRIISHDVDVVGGFYPKKQQGPLEWVINTFPEPTICRDDGLQQVAYIGTGFICIRRSVFERMIAAHPEIEFNADYGARAIEHDLWPMGVYTYKSGHRRYLSEDWYFCQRWMDLGGEVFGDTRIILKHIGPVIFPLVTQEPEIMNPK